MSDALKTMSVGQIRSKARADAARVLAGHWPMGSVPVDPVAVARSLGLSVFTAELGEDAWGMLIGSGSGVDMYIDREQPPTRFRFSCAHEIGHFVDHDFKLSPDEAYVEARSDADRGRADEVFANEFAGSLLMPEAAFLAAVRWGEDNFDLARRFDVSLDAVYWRRRHLQA